MNRIIKSVGLLSLYMLFFNIYINSYAADPIIVGIQLNGVNAIPGATKHYQVCKDVPFYLKSENLSTNKPAGTAIYKWTNIDSVFAPMAGQQIMHTAPGRWVSTIRYLVGATVVAEASDTIFINYYPSVPFNIVTVAEVIITAPGVTNMTICGSKDSTIGATNGFNDYKWYKNSNSELVGTSRMLTITTAIMSTGEINVSFIVTAKDPNSCAVSKQIYITRTVDIPVQIEGPSVACNGETVVLSSPSSPDPSSSYSYLWNNGVTAQKTIPVTAGGTYWLKITNSRKCSVIDYHVLVTGAGSGITISPDTSICFGTAVKLEASMPGNASYIWNGPGLTNATGSVQTVIPAAQGPNSYTVTVTSNVGCPGNKSTIVTVLDPSVNPYFTMTAGNDTVLCDKTSGQMHASITSSAYPATYTWAWNPVAGLDNPNTQNPTVTSTSSAISSYSVIATDSRGCKKTSAVNINTLPSPVVYTNFVDSSACFGNVLQIEAIASGGTTGPGGYTYIFNPPSGTITGSSMYATTGQGNDIYKVSAKDSKGCPSNVVDVTIRGYAPPVHMSDSKDTIGFNNTPITLYANTPSSNIVVWRNISGDSLSSGPSYIVTTDDTIVADVKDPVKGCTNTDTISVVFYEGDPYVVYIPNVFSPAGTNPENRVVKVYGTLIREDNFHFRVYNQWGQLVHQTSSFIDANSNGWTGEIKGNNGTQSTAVYTYTVEGEFYDGTEFSKVGTTTMLQ